jgi:RNA polymerase sigma-70 factor (ECF subfamily)
VDRISTDDGRALEPSEEKRLILALRTGDRAAFERVYGRYAGRLWNFLARMVGDDSRAEDLHQETWMKLAVHAHRLAEDTDLGAWLYTVARNLARSERRTVRARPPMQAISDRAPNGGAPPDEIAFARQTEERLERALAELSPPFREVLLLVAVEGIEQERAAAILGLSREALRQRLARARAKLSDRLAELSQPPRAILEEESHARRSPA